MARKNPTRFHVEARPEQAVDGEQAWVFVVTGPGYDATFASGVRLAQFIEGVLNGANAAFGDKSRG